MDFTLPSFNKPELFLHARLDHLSLDYHLSVCVSVSRTPADVASTKGSGSGSPRQQQPILTSCPKLHGGTPHRQGTRAQVGDWRGRLGVDDMKRMFVTTGTNVATTGPQPWSKQTEPWTGAGDQEKG